MKRDPIGVKSKIAGLAQEVDGHLRRAAEFARQRPFGAVAIDQDTAEDPRAGSGARELLQLARAVEREQPDALLVSIDDVTFLLDGVTEGDALRRRALRQAEFDLGAARNIEVGAEPAQARGDLRRRVGLDRVEDLGERQVPAQALIATRDGINIDDKTRRLRLLLGKEASDLGVEVAI